MKRTVFVLLLCLVALSFTAGCSRKVNEVKPDTPLDTVFLMNVAIMNKDYQQFRGLLLDSKREVYTEDDLEALNNIIGPGSSQHHYIMCDYGNGKSVLFEITQRPVDGRYYIQNIVIVPEEAYELFRGKTSGHSN